ncbi:trypsin-like peptidase domain-containing protein [Streptomyces sp. BE147]|uniref:VMAP-C domain-containing protein n=1 Tax=unclassified Streptomyces TaxID=2593676 RepID=UPI002E77F25F|nr:trypsin-like peptidase domain-containing protein [Streptomyces sp. BE147]MEE1737119.1 trypsin-like peptidase domain-containing protein [Streptomyces sp. BE147]
MSDGLPDLDALVRAATVHFLPPEPDQDRMWGSGFFVAPGWILTAAHVLLPYVREDQGRRFRVAGDQRQHGIAPAPARLEQWLVGDPWSDHVPAQRDLALVRLLDDTVEHECVWLSDQMVSSGGDRVAFGFRPTPDEAEEDISPYGLWRGAVKANVDDGALAVRFESLAEFPPGVSGGPVLDPATGAVLEIVKSGRAEQDGGRAVSAAALRRFGVLYREVMDAHDRWHHGRRADTGSWTSHQGRLVGGGSGADAEQWSPEDRVNALNHLAGLATPLAGDAAGLARHVRNERLPHTVPAPLTWRDGHGLLYRGDGTPLPAYVFMHYLRLVGELTRGYGGDTSGLDDWLDGRLRRLPPHLRRLVEQARLPERDSTERVVIPYPGLADPAHIVVVELDELPYGTLHWQIRIDDGSGDHEIFASETDPNGVAPGRLRVNLREHLAEAFQFADMASGVPAPCEVVVPAGYFDTPVHRWQLADDARLGDPAHLPVGVRRRIVLRNVDRRGEPDAGWSDRWSAAAGRGPLTASRVPPAGQPPRSRHFAEIQPSGIPVLCHPASRGIGRKAIEFAFETGHGIALWRIDGHDRGPCDSDCEDLHKGVAELLARTESLPELPDRLRRIREEIHENRTTGHWAESVAVMYDDPRRPVPERPVGPVDSP